MCWGVGFPVLAHRAQLGRVGGSRWGWVLEIKFPCQVAWAAPDWVGFLIKFPCQVGSLNKIPVPVAYTTRAAESRDGKLRAWAEKREARMFSRKGSET